MKRFLKWLPAIVIVLLLVDLLAFNHVLDLRSEEGRRAIVSIEMLESGNLTVPQLQCHPYYNKPPLYNWVIALFFWLFGDASEWVLRLPGVLSFLASGALLYAFVKRHGNPAHALIIALAYLCSTDLLFYGSVNAGEIDLFYTLVVMLQVMSIYHFYKHRNWSGLFLISYFFMTIGVLTKGLPSIAFQGLTLLPFLIWKKEWKRLFSLQHIAGILLFIGLSTIYYYFYAQQEDVVAYLINTFKQASQRTASEHSLQETILGLFDFPVYLLSKVMPWSLLLIFLALKPVRKALAAQDVNRFTLLFIVCNIWIYWLSPEMRIRYVYMFFPFLTLFFLEGALTEDLRANHFWSFGKRFLAIAFGLASIALIASPALVNFLPVELSLGQLTTAFLIGLVFGGLSYTQWQSKSGKQAIWILIAGLAISRLGFNIIGLPLTQDALKQRAYTEHLIELADGEPIFLFGHYALNPDLSLFGTTFYQSELTVPSEIPYQVPYYYYLETGQLICHSYEMESGKLYFTYDIYVSEGDSVLDFNHDVYPAVGLVLVRRE